MDKLYSNIQIFEYNIQWSNIQIIDIQIFEYQIFEYRSKL